MRLTESKILGRAEFAAVLAYLRKNSRRYPNVRLNLILFRLSTCCGLRASEIAGLRLDDLRLGDRPTIRVRAETAKRRKARVVPLHWDRATLDDLTAWKASRLAKGAATTDPVLVTGKGRPFCRQGIRNRYRTACRVLGAERLSTITVHTGRHTYISFALAGGRPLAQVQAAAGHSSVATTFIYTHLVVDEDETIGNLFEAR